MKRRETSRIQFDALQIEGALIQPDVVAKIAAGQAWGQTDESYGVLPGLKLRDEIGRYYQVGRTLWQRFETGRAGENADLAHMQFSRDFLTKVLGFELADAAPRPTSLVYQIVFTKNRHVPVAIAGAQGLDKAETVATAGGNSIRRSATTAVQGELNGSDLALWGLACDGGRLRVLRDNASLTRPALIEFDLDRIFRTDLYADFTLLWLLVHESRFGDGEAPSSACALETWRHQGREQGVAARGRLRDGVEMALYEFGCGFLEHPENGDLRSKLSNAKISKDEYFQQLLRLVYRLIFTMTAEDREILHAPDSSDGGKTTYKSGYSLSRMRERSRIKSAWDRYHDAFEGAKVIFRCLDRGENLLALPALGGLFDSSQTPELDGAKISNRRFLTGLFHLGWMRQDSGLVRINWQDMETEEFGSVYESLLELTPAFSDDARSFYFLNGIGDSRASKLGSGVQGNRRKTTGSYYTPDALVELLLDQTLNPKIEKIIAENPTNPDALLELSVVDPACGSGHFILGAARRIARRLAELRNPGSASIAEYRHALRQVIGHCIYGVDRNEMAVELCRVALWIEAVDPGKPLSFIESKIRCGDSLVGVFNLNVLASGIPDEAYKRLTGDQKDAAVHYRKRNKSQRDGHDQQIRLSFSGPPDDIAEAQIAIEMMPDDSIEGIARKRDAYLKLQRSSQWTNLKLACDLWTAAFFVPKIEIETTPASDIIPSTDHVWLACQGTALRANLTESVQTLALRQRFFHWHLEFPDVFEQGGFDIVLGNPPWEVSEFDEIEYFSSRAPDIAALPGSARKQAIASLEMANPILWDSYQIQKRSHDAVNEFYRESGRFDLTAKGKVNTYALFAEHFARLAQLLPSEPKDRAASTVRVGAKLGASGIIVPTGIATDDSTSTFFASLIQLKHLRSLISFYEIRAWFPATDDRNPFSIMSMGVTEKDPIMIFDAKKITDAQDRRKAFKLSAADLALFNPNTKTAPTFRSEHDAELTRRIYNRLPIINDLVARSNPWGVVFKQGLFNMTGDSALFRTSAQLAAAAGVRSSQGWSVPKTNSESINETPGRWVPLVEGKLINHFDHRYGTYAALSKRPTYSASLPEPSLSERRDPSFEIEPWYWVHEDAVDEALRNNNWSRDWLCGWRDVTKALNERTTIISCFPRWGAGHTLPLVFCDPLKSPVAVLIGGWSSIVFDYFARQKLNGPHLTFTYLRQFPFPAPEQFTEDDRSFLTRRVLELSYTSDSMAGFARDIGFEGGPFIWDEDRRALLRSELDAFFAQKFGLTNDELQYVLDPSALMGSDYPSETFRVLKTNEIAQFGEYRTAKLIMQAWDRLERGEIVDVPAAAINVSIPTAKRSISTKPSSLANGAWKRAGESSDELLAQLAALIKALPGPTPISTVCLAFIYAWQPQYLAKRLEKADRSNWLRLVGPAAKPADKNVVVLTPAIDIAFRDAVKQLRGMRALVEDSAAGTWAAGPPIDEFEVDTDAWAYGRARFALDSMQAIDFGDAVKDLPEAERELIGNANAA